MDTTEKLNSPLSSEDQMDVMMMMQLQEFSAAFSNNDTVEKFPPPQLISASSNTLPSSTTMPLANLIDNRPMPAYSSFTHSPSSTISFTNNNKGTPIFEEQQQTPPSLMSNPYGGGMAPSEKRNSMAAMREMIFRIAAMQPIHIDPESVKAPKRRNVKISKDPQSVAARHRRERISERIRILQRLVPGGTKMDTASMLDEAIHYVKFLKTQVQSLQQRAAANNTTPLSAAAGVPFPVAMSSRSINAPLSPYLHHLPKPYQPRNVEHYEMHDN